MTETFSVGDTVRSTRDRRLISKVTGLTSVDPLLYAGSCTPDSQLYWIESLEGDKHDLVQPWDITKVNESDPEPYPLITEIPVICRKCESVMELDGFVYTHPTVQRVFRCPLCTPLVTQVVPFGKSW